MDRLNMATQSQTAPERVLSLLQDTQERRTAVCEKALSIYSPSGDERDLARFLFSELKERGLKPVIDAAGNVLCEVGSGNVSILFCGHMDTVPGELPVRREGSIHWRGCDGDEEGVLLKFILGVNAITEISKV